MADHVEALLDFVVPVPGARVARRADEGTLVTWLAIIFTAVETAFSSPEKSPVESGWRCSVSIVCRVSVLRTSGMVDHVLGGLLEDPAGQDVLGFEAA